MSTPLETRLSHELKSRQASAGQPVADIGSAMRGADRRHQRQKVLSVSATSAGVVVLAYFATQNAPSTRVVTAAAIEGVDGPATSAAAEGADVLEITAAQNGTTGNFDAIVTVVIAAAPVALGIFVVLAAISYALYTLMRGDKPTCRVCVVASALLVPSSLVAAFIVTFNVFFLSTPSMEPTFQQDERVLVDSRDRTPELGDAVTIEVNASGRASMTQLRRVVGLGGDVVEATNGSLFVNDRAVVGWIDASSGELEPFGPVTVPSGEVFVIGDNHRASLDSRTYGTIDEQAVTGTVRWRTR